MPLEIRGWKHPVRVGIQATIGSLVLGSLLFVCFALILMYVTFNRLANSGVFDHRY